MEEKIVVIGTRKIFSKKLNKDLYVVDYVGNNKIPTTDFIEVEEFKKISEKMKPLTEQVGIFGINTFRKVYLKDLK